MDYKKQKHIINRRVLSLVANDICYCTSANANYNQKGERRKDAEKGSI